MYQALIIDDETPVRQAVRALGEWEALGIAPPAEAPDGQSGLDIMAGRKIDIVLVDIKMPVMDGMEFLKLATAKFPDTKYIIVSGYGEFNYAQKAIGFHVVDYLLKPIVCEQLNQALKNTVQALDRENKIASLNPIIDVASHLADLPAGESDYGIVLLHEMNHAPEDREAPAGDAFLRTLAAQWDKSSACYARWETKTDILLAVTVPCGGKTDAAGYAADCAAELIRWIKRECGADFIAGVGTFGDDIQALSPSYYHARYIINNVNLLAQKRSVYTQAEFCDTHKWASIIDKKTQFALALKNGSMPHASEIIEQYCAALEKAGFLSMDDLERTYLNFILILSETAEEERVPEYRKILYPAYGAPGTERFTRPAQVATRVFSLFQELYGNYRRAERFSITDMVEEIKSYIDENYAGDISLNVFALKYHMTKEYLSKQFKKSYGCGIYEYVLKTRMQAAVHLLADAQVKVQDISECVGYSDTNYFSRAFKSFYGVSPQKYREEHCGGATQES